MNEEKIAKWISKSEITNVLNTYFRAIDEKNFDVKHMQSILTDDANLVRPNGAKTVGPEAIGTSNQTSFARFESTQHFVTGHDIYVDEDTAKVRVNVAAMHMWDGSKNDARNPENFFVGGVVITAELRLIDNRWKISLLEGTNKWRGGSGFQNMLQDTK